MIDKGFYRQNFGGGADMGGVKGDTRAANTGLSGGYQGGEKGGYGRRDSVQDRDRDVGVTKSAVGTLSDPREKMNYFGSTIFGPSRKYTGSFLDRILGGGYRAVQPYAPDQFQSRFSQMGGLGKGILGGLISLINPVAGLAYRGIDKLGALRDYKTLADYARGEFGLFQDEDEDEIDTIDIRDKYNRSGIMNPNIRPTQMFNFDPTQFNTRNRNLGELVAELTDKQKAFINSKKFALENEILSPQQVFETITNPNKGIYDTGIFGVGAQETTTEEEYNDYLRSLGLTQKI